MRLKSLLAAAPNEKTPGVAARRRAEKQVQVRLTADQVAELVEAFRSGERVTHLASRYGVSRNTVNGHLKRNGIELSLRALNDEQVELARRRYEVDGRSLADIAEEFGVVAGTIQK